MITVEVTHVKSTQLVSLITFEFIIFVAALEIRSTVRRDVPFKTQAPKMYSKNCIFA
jgi:hypothetical protein